MIPGLATMRRVLSGVSLGVLLLLASAGAVSAADLVGDTLPPVPRDLGGELEESKPQPPTVDPGPVERVHREARAVVAAVDPVEPVTSAERVGAVVVRAVGLPELPAPPTDLPPILPVHPPVVAPPAADLRDVRDLAPEVVTWPTDHGPTAAIADSAPVEPERAASTSNAPAAAGVPAPVLPAFALPDAITASFGTSLGTGAWIALIGCVAVAFLWTATRSASLRSRPPLSLSLLPPVPPG